MILQISIAIVTTLADENWIAVPECIVHEVVNVVMEVVVVVVAVEHQTDVRAHEVAAAAVAAATTHRPENGHTPGSADNLFYFSFIIKNF